MCCPRENNWLNRKIMDMFEKCVIYPDIFRLLLLLCITFEISDGNHTVDVVSEKK